MAEEAEHDGAGGEGAEHAGAEHEGTGHDGAGTWQRHRRTVATAAGLLAVAVMLFLAYLGQSRGIGIDSDNASAVLQGHTMAGGNLLLHGWFLSDVSFYTTEIPQYALLTLVHGANAETMKLAAAMTYTLVVLLAAFAAKGRARGRAALLRMAVPTVVLLAPQAINGTAVLLSGPDHVGTLVPLLVCWILIDRLPERWYLPVVAGVLLCWVEMADQMAVYVGAVPLAAVAAIRLYRRSGSRVDAGLLGAAVLSVPAADLLVRGIRAAGGFYVWPNKTDFVPDWLIGHNALVTGESLLSIFGGYFFGMPLGLASVVVLLHLLGLALVAWAMARVMRAPAVGRLEPILAIAVVVDLVAYLVGTQATAVNAAREIAPVLVFGAVLAGRVLGERIAELRLVPVLVVLLVVMAGSLGYNATRPAVSLRSPLGDWLADHHLVHGLGDYWIADATTVQTDGRVTIRSIAYECGAFRPYLWETDTRWYEPSRHTANFLVLDAKGGTDGNRAEAVRMFGHPVSVAHVDGDTVLAYDRNLISSLSIATARGCTPGV